MTTDRCAIVGYSVDENAARVNAAVALLFVAAWYASGWVMLLVLLAADFFVRGFVHPRYSPVALLQVEPVRVDAGPKRFAARIGFFMTGAAVVLAVAHAEAAAAVLVGMLGFCAALEAFVGYCVGCTLYSLLHRFVLRT
jgi:hypothetical protein